MSFVKYRLKEVATDFGTTPKEIADILGKYGERPKSNTQVLTEAELNCIFDHMTKNNQVANLDQVFAAKPTAPKAEPRKEAPRGEGRPQGQNNRPQGQATVPKIRTTRDPSRLSSPRQRLPSSPSPSVSVSAAWSIPLLFR